MDGVPETKMFSISTTLDSYGNTLVDTNGEIDGQYIKADSIAPISITDGDLEIIGNTTLNGELTVIENVWIGDNGCGFRDNGGGDLEFTNDNGQTYTDVGTGSGGVGDALDTEILYNNSDNVDGVSNLTVSGGIVYIDGVQLTARGAFDINIEGQLTPTTDSFNDPYWEVNGSDQLTPKST